MWRTGMYTNKKAYSGLASEQDKDNFTSLGSDADGRTSKVSEKVAALKREMMLKNKATARKRNEEWLKRRLEQLNIDERKSEARREEADKLRYLEECTKFA